MVRRALRQLGVAPSNLDDAVQDVFVVLHRRIDDWDRERSLKNWLWGIARGVASGYRRSERRRDRLHAVLPAPERTGLPERGLARTQAGAILDDFLGSLDADKCAVFVLSEIEGRRGPEIAELLDVNVNTVYARLRAARKRFDVAMARHHTPSRPVFAAWLSFSWPAWLSKPAVAVGVSALAVVAATEVAPKVAIEPREASVVAAHEIASVEDEAAPRWPRAVAPRMAVRQPVAPPEDDDDEILVFEEDEAPAPVRRRRPLVQPTTLADASTDAGALELIEPETVVGPPARAPWEEHVVGQRPVRHPTLLTLRQDFVSELWRIAMDI